MRIQGQGLGIKVWGLWPRDQGFGFRLPNLLPTAAEQLADEFQHPAIRTFVEDTGPGQKIKKRAELIFRGGTY